MSSIVASSESGGCVSDSEPLDSSASTCASKACPLALGSSSPTPNPGAEALDLASEEPFACYAECFHAPDERDAAPMPTESGMDPESSAR